MKYITKSVWILSIVSLLNDAASEMLYPIMPIYLKSIGFSIVLIGVLEGIAEATAGLSKGFFGQFSDNLGKKAPFIQVGYALSAISKPMMAIFIFPFWVFLARTLDRLGKGIRTGARDAMLSDEATPETKAKVFGFHKSMDTMGAVIGPLFALIFLYFYPKNYNLLFFIAFIPGFLAVLCTFFLKDSKNTLKKPTKITLFSFFNYWNQSPILYKKLLFGLLAFALFNSSDLFLILKAKECGLNDTELIGAYIFYNLIFATFSLPLGILADKIGLKKMYIFGLFLYAIVYFGIAFTNNLFSITLIFVLYGIYAAATEGIAKAWISNLTPKNEVASAIGTFSGFQSLAAMVASTLAGFMWYYFGSNITFFVTSGVTFLVIIYFIFAVPFKQFNKSTL